MSRLIEIGDFVLVSLDDTGIYYQIRRINTDGIFISPINEPSDVSQLIYDSDNQKWIVSGPKETPDYNLDFLSRDEYNNLINLESQLLNIAPEILTQIALNLYL